MAPSSNGQHNFEDSLNGQPLRAMLREHIQEQKEYNLKIERALNILVGDPEMKNGLIHKVSTHERYISNDKRLKWIGAGVAATSGAGFWEAIKHFFIK